MLEVREKRKAGDKTRCKEERNEIRGIEDMKSINRKESKHKIL